MLSAVKINAFQTGSGDIVCSENNFGLNIFI